MKIAQPLIASAAVFLLGTAAMAEVKPADLVWVDDISVPVSVSGTAGNPEEGAKVISSRALGNCVSCHENSAMPDVQFQGNVGPSLDGTGSRWSEAELRGILVDAKQVFPETIMPAFYQDNTSRFIRPGKAYTAGPADETFSTLLTAQQIEDVVAYLTTLTD
jgi:sulfur-oxidizing protein SoxX